MYRKLLFNKLSIGWNITILLISFCQESVQIFVQISEIVCLSLKKKFCDILRICQKKIGMQMGVAYTTRFKSQFSERMDFSFLNVQQTICELQAKTDFP